MKHKTFWNAVSDCKIYQERKERKRKKISLPIAQYIKEMKHTIGLSEYDGIRKMLNINYQGKVPSKTAVAENWKDLFMMDQPWLASWPYLTK